MLPSSFPYYQKTHSIHGTESKESCRKTEAGFPNSSGIVIQAEKMVGKLRCLISTRYSQLEKEELRDTDLKGVHSESKSIPFLS